MTKTWNVVDFSLTPPNTHTHPSQVSDTWFIWIHCACFACGFEERRRVVQTTKSNICQEFNRGLCDVFVHMYVSKHTSSLRRAVRKKRLNSMKHFGIILLTETSSPTRPQPYKPPLLSLLWHINKCCWCIVKNTTSCCIFSLLLRLFRGLTGSKTLLQSQSIFLSNKISLHHPSL